MKQDLYWTRVETTSTTYTNMGSIEPTEISKPGKRLKTIDWGRDGTMMSFDQFGTVNIPNSANHGNSNQVLVLATGCVSSAPRSRASFPFPTI